MDATTLPLDVSMVDTEALFERQRRHQIRVRATDASERAAKIKRLREAVLRHRATIHKALAADLGKASEETDLTEIVPVLSEARHAERHVRQWMQPHKVSTPLTLVGTSSHIRYEPKGVVLIISPWNYPFTVTLKPLISAIAAGNCVIIKPSEFTPNASAALQTLLSEVFSEDEVAVVQGEADVAQRLLQLPFNHVFFTGSPRVGKLVMQAAAHHLASVTLELGGKSPTLLDASADVATAASKIAFGKFTNAGQTCIAPDYVLVPTSLRTAFLEALAHEIETRYSGKPSQEGLAPIARIVSERHHHRLTTLLADAIEHEASIVTGGQAELEERYIAPTVVTDLAPDDALLREEIFGPILPVIPYDTLDEALAFIHARPKPLAMYLFGTDKRVIEDILQQTSAGGTVVNDVILHYVHPELPFGGVNNSGIGKSHGRHGFLAFSNERGILVQQRKRPLFRFFYPPFSSRTQSLITGLIQLISR